MTTGVPLVLSVPKSTLASAPVSLEVSSLNRFIVGGRLSFPGGSPGPAGLLYMRLMSREHPVFPFTGEFINGHSGDVFTFDGYWPMDGPPWRLRLEAYNLDDTYPHTARAMVIVQ